MEKPNCLPQPIVLTGLIRLLEDDCACPDHSPAVQPSFSRNNLYTVTPGIYTTQLNEQFWMAFSPFAPQGPSVLNQEAWARLNQFHTALVVERPVDHILAEQHLILPDGGRPVPQKASPEVLTAWLHITNACNLDCPYCYVRKSSASMSLEIGLKAVERIFTQAHTHGFRSVKLKYAGGESTLQFRLIRCLHARAQEMAMETGLGLQAVILSNGTRLRASDADWILENQVNIMISLDGVGARHDQMRPALRGGSAFDALAYTLDHILIPRGIRPFASVTITSWNASSAAEAVRWALARKLPISLNFYRQTASAPANLALEEESIIQGMLESYRAFEDQLPLEPFLNGLLDRVQMDAHLHTCGVGINYMVVTHEGKLAQCQMHQDRPLDATLDENWLLVLNSGWIQNISVDEKAGCRDCTYRYRCSGGCPLETYRFTGRWDVQSPNCRIYKALLPAALRLEGLRLLKQHGYIQ